MHRRFVLLAILLLVTATASFAQWIEATGISGPRGHSLTAVNIYDGTIFFGTGEGGLYRIASQEFVPVRSGLPIGGIQSIEWDGESPLYVGVWNDGTYSSTDGGESWTRLDIEGAVTDVKVVGYWTFITTDRAFYRTITGSETFERLLDQGTEMEATSVASDGEVLFAGSYSAVSRSTDLGLTWTRVDIPDDDHFAVGVGDIAITPAGITAIAMRYRFISTDNGLSYTAIEDVKEPMVYKAISDGDRLIAAMDDGLYTSTDGGRTMQLLLEDEGAWFADVAKQAGKMVAVTEHKLFISEDNGETWETVLPQISAQSVAALAVINDLVFAASDLLYRSDDDAHSFAPATTDTTSLALRDIHASGSRLFALSGPSTILRSSDNGASWEDISGPIGAEGIPIAAFHVDGSTILAGSYLYGIYYSNDNGTTWSVATDGGSGAFQYPRTFASFNNRIYLATQNHLLESTDRGATWTAVTAAVTDEPIVAMTTNSHTLYAATSTRTYSLSSTGQWTAGGAVPEATVLLASNDTPILYAGTAGYGVWQSGDNGASWISEWQPGNGGLSGNAAVIHDLAYAASGFILVAATESNVWSVWLEGMSVREPAPDLPQNLSAHYDRNDGAIYLMLSMPSPSRADIELVDLRGTTVRRLADERLQGTVSKSFSIAPLPAGMYFLTVRTDKGISSVAVPILAR